MKKFWKKISYIGLNHFSEEEIVLHYRSTILINRIISILIILMVGFIPFEISVNGFELFWLISLEIFSISFVLILNYYKRFEAAKYYYLVISIALVSISPLIIPPGSGNELLFIPTTTMGILLLRNKLAGVLYACFTYSILILIFSVRDNIDHIYKLSPEILKESYPIFVTMTILIVFYVVYYFRSINESFQDLIQLQNNLLTQQTEEITTQSEEIFHQNKELSKKNTQILDSINYGKRIQSAMLPQQEDIAKAIQKTFVYFNPKEAVSGDFYWFSEINIKGNKSQILAAVDCTGHGIPGAFMSMIGNELLNKIVLEKDIYQPDLILNELHKGVRRILKQDQNESYDGMDICLIRIDKWDNKLYYAGAMNPLYYVQNNEFFVVNANKINIGGKQLEEERFFTLHTIEITQTTQFYLTSDGFQDQFGGKEGRKFMVKKFRELLYEITDLSADEQKEKLSEVFNSWKGEREQMDDVLILGGKV